MDRSFLTKFLTRWLVSSLGLWVASGLLGSSHLSVGGSWMTMLWAGFFFALVNTVLKPLLIFLSIPAIILSLGLFMLVVNGLVVLIASWLYSPLYVAGLWWAILAGVIVGLVNYMVTSITEGFEQ